MDNKTLLLSRKEIVKSPCNIHNVCNNADLYLTFTSEEPDFKRVRQILLEDMSNVSIIKAYNLLRDKGFSYEYASTWISYYITLITEIGDHNLYNLINTFEKMRRN